MPELIICESPDGKGPNCTCSRRGNSYGHECSCDFCRAYWRRIFRDRLHPTDQN